MRIPPKRWVSPFGNPRIKAYLSAPRGLSQTYTSFIAFCRQGIHRVRLVTWSYNPKPFRRQLPALCVGAFVLLGHVLVYAPSLHLRPALIAETWLEMAHASNTPCCISTEHRRVADLGLTNGGAAKLLRTNTNTFDTTYRTCFADTVLCSFRISIRGDNIAISSIRNPKRS